MVMNITAGGFVDDEAKPLALRTDDLGLVPNADVPRGVAFLLPPTEFGPATTATLDDAWGDLVQIVSRN